MKKIAGLPDLFVGNIFCIGRNYAKHAEELGNDVPDEPMVFLKPTSCIIYDGDTILLPEQSTDVHHEAELVIAIGKEGKDIRQERALEYVAGYGIGIDVTARDLQSVVKEKRHPWSVAKGFDTFAPISDFRPIEHTTDFGSMRVQLHVNDQPRQDGQTQHMIFTVQELIGHLSSIFTLHPGDLIFTGTPEGVSAIHSGDAITARLSPSDISLTVSVR